MGFGGGGGSDPAPPVVDETKTTAAPAPAEEDKGRPGTRRVSRFASQEGAGALMEEDGSESGGDGGNSGRKRINARSSTASVLGSAGASSIG